MTTLYISYIPADFEELKIREPDRISLIGSAIYALEVFKALLKYSSYDKILVPDLPRLPRGDIRTSSSLLNYADRLQTAASDSLADLAASCQRFVLFAPGPNLDPLLRLRRRINRMRSPCVGIIHSLNSSAQMQTILNYYLAPTHKWDAIVCSSAAGQTAFRNLATTAKAALAQVAGSCCDLQMKMPVIPLGIDAENYLGPTSDSARDNFTIGEGIVLLYVGRFSNASKSDLVPLIIAFNEIYNRHRDVWLVLAGDDVQHNLSPRLTQIAQDLGCADRIRIIPNPTHAEKINLYRIADVFVSLVDSLQETFGITVIEAMAAGLPVVASDWSGYRDIVVHNRTGFLVPTLLPIYPHAINGISGPQHLTSPDLLAASTIVDLGQVIEYLERLITTPMLRAEMADNSIARVRELYDWRQVVRSYESLWNELDNIAQSAHGDQEPSYSLSYSYLDVFDHYPTQLLPPNATIELTNIGRSALSRENALTIVALGRECFSLPLFTRVLSAVATLGRATVFDLLNEINHWPDESAVGMSHIYRLGKCGFLKLSVPAGKIVQPYTVQTLDEEYARTI